MFNVILTTYQRPDEFSRLLDAIMQVDWSLLNSDYKILIYDDFPKSKLQYQLHDILDHPKIEYHRRVVNLGQGQNHMDAVRDIPEGQYIWMPGDDDIVNPQEFNGALNAINRLDPDVLLLEFRQGPNLQHGTFYETHLTTINDVDAKIEVISRFGKCTSTIFKKPSVSVSNYINNEFTNCMYPDKAFGIARALEHPHSKVMCYNNLVAHGDANYGKLRYSMRVFRNLNTIAILISAFLKIEITQSDFKGEARWWMSGLISTISPNSEIKYTSKRFMIELFWPLWRMFVQRSDFCK